jgi:4'-phosphopantetheinyl transferase
MICNPPPLSSDTLHVWSVPLDPARDAYESLATCLAPDERARAASFRFDRDRRRFSTARAVLRHVISAYLGCPPQHIRLHYGSHGKPRLSLEEGAAIDFNVAHSDALALIALTQGRLVGVDLERIRPEIVTDALAAAILSPAETVLFYSLTPEKRADAFFSIWTRKEAYLKATGDGLSRSLDEIETVSAADFSAVCPEDNRCLDGWTVRALSPAPGYAAAVAFALHDPARVAARSETSNASFGVSRRAIERPATEPPTDIARLEVFRLPDCAAV